MGHLFLQRTRENLNMEVDNEWKFDDETPDRAVVIQRPDRAVVIQRPLHRMAGASVAQQ